MVLTRNSSLVLATSADKHFSETGTFQKKRENNVTLLKNSSLALSGTLVFLVELSPASFGKKEKKKSISVSFMKYSLLPLT